MSFQEYPHRAGLFGNLVFLVDSYEINISVLHQWLTRTPQVAISLRAEPDASLVSDDSNRVKSR